MKYPEMASHETHCLECGDPIYYGRADRKFCCDVCKNSWHNRKKRMSWERYKQKTVQILEKNHEILSRLLSIQMTSIDKVDLVQMGYNFNYVTSYQKICHRDRYCCFDIRYDATDRRIFHIESTFVRTRPEKMKNPGLEGETGIEEEGSD